MTGLQCGEKKCNNILSCFHRIPECKGQTDGRTDRHVIFGFQNRILGNNIKTAFISFYGGVTFTISVPKILIYF